MYSTATAPGTRRNPLFRRLDRWVGIPLVMLLGAFRGLRRRGVRRRGAPSNPRTVAFLKVAAIGDTLLLSAVVQDARAAWPAARIVFFAGEDNAGAARLIPGIDEVVVLPVSRPWRAVALLRRSPLDLLIDCGPWPRVNAVLAALSGARFAAGFRTPGQHRHHAYDLAVPHSAERHEVDNYRALVRALGVATTHGPMARCEGTLAPALTPRGRYAVLHMWSAGTGGWQKEWPSERWHAVARELASRGLEVLVTGGRSDAGRAAEFVREVALKDVRSTAGELTLREVGVLLSRAAVVISVNTGIMHLSAMVGAPTISLEGPTPVRRWGPIGPRVRSVCSSYAGCGFLHLGWEYAGNRADCMLGIDVGTVMAAVDELL